MTEGGGGRKREGQRRRGIEEKGQSREEGGGGRRRRSYVNASQEVNTTLNKAHHEILNVMFLIQMCHSVLTVEVLSLALSAIAVRAPGKREECQRAHLATP